MPVVEAKMRFEEVESQVLDLVQNEIIIQADQSSDTIAKRLTDAVALGQHRDGAYLFSELSRLLIRRYLVRTILRERRKSQPKVQAPLLFPDLEHLPRRIVTPEGKRPLLSKATATEIRQYVKSLNQKHRDRIAELQAVLELMAPYIRNNRGITAAEVAARLDAA